MTTVPQTIRTYNVWTEDQPFAARTERVDGPHDPADPELRAEMARQGILGLTHAEVVRRLIFGGWSVNDPARPWGYQQEPMLCAKQVDEVRRLYRAGRTQMDLAWQFRVSQTTISAVVRGMGAYGGAS